MTQKKFLIFLFLTLLFPINKISAEIANVGFIPDNIWYSKDPFFEGDKIKIYTLIFNPDGRELSGTVSFFDKTILLGKKDFRVSGNGVKDISIEWTAIVGKHAIFAKIENTKFLVSPGKYENVYLKENETIESKRNVSKTIAITKSTDEEEPSENLSNDKKIQNFILEKTPSFITEPIIENLELIEGWREDQALSAKNKKDEMKMYQILYFIFNSKIIFYGIIILLIFLTGRYLLNKIL